MQLQKDFLYENLLFDKCGRPSRTRGMTIKRNISYNNFNTEIAKIIFDGWSKVSNKD